MGTGTSSSSSSQHDQHLQARRLLAVQYAARLPPRSPAFRWPSSPRTLLAIQHDLDADLFESDVLQPASATYTRLFLKTLIERIQDAISQGGREEQGQGGAGSIDEDELEMDDALMERYTSLLASSGTSSIGPSFSTSNSSSSIMSGPPPPSTVQYLYAIPRHGLTRRRDASKHSDLLSDLSSIVLQESGTMISQGTTGLRTWEASLALGSNILASAYESSTSMDSDGGARLQGSSTSSSLWHAITRPDARVLELGSGVGMLGVLCAQLQQDLNLADVHDVQDRMESIGTNRTAPQVYLTDVQGPVLDSLARTAEQNGLSSSPNVHIAPLDWVECAEEIQRTDRSPISSAAHQPQESTKSRDKPISSWLQETAKPTLILAADVVFDPCLCAPLARTLRVALEAARRAKSDEFNDKDRDGDGPEQAQQPIKTEEDKEDEPSAYIASTIRNPPTYATFLAALREAGLHFDRVELEGGGRVRCISGKGRLDEYGEEEDEDEDDGDVLQLPSFPSTHDASRDGPVELLRVRLARTKRT